MKSLKRKLSIKSKTIANLSNDGMNAIKGGDEPTNPPFGCETDWCSEAYTACCPHTAGGASVCEPCHHTDQPGCQNETLFETCPETCRADCGTQTGSQMICC